MSPQTPITSQKRRLAESNRCSDPLALACLQPLRGKGAAIEIHGPAFTEECWLWRGSLNSKGYALRGTRDGGLYLVHRRVFEQAVRPLADGEQIHHVCGVKRCVNPAHLVPLVQIAHSRVDGTVSSAAVAYVDEHGVCAPRDVARFLGANAHTVGTALWRAADRGEVVRHGHGLYGPLVLQAVAA